MDTVEFELPEIDWKLAGTRIRAARNYRGMTARKLSELVGISEESLLHLECGNRRPSYITIYRIAVALDVSLDYLSCRTERQSEQVPTPQITGSNMTEKQTKAMDELTRALAPVVRKIL